MIVIVSGDFTFKHLSSAASNEATSGRLKLKMKYRSLSHNMINASTVVGTIRKHSGRAIQLSQICSYES
jgi:hypothetical protein